MEKGQKTRWKTSSESSLLLKTHCFIASHFTLRVVLHRFLFVAEPSAASASAARGPSLRAHRGRSLRFSAERFRCTDAWKKHGKIIWKIYEYVQILRWIWKILIFRNTTFSLFFWNHLKFNQKDRWSSPPPGRSPEMICRTCRSTKASSAKMLWVAVQTNLYTFYVSTFPSLTSTRCSNWLQIVLILLRLAVYEQGFSDLCLRRCFWPLHVHSYCWWTKSCTTKDDDYPIIYRVLTIPGGAGLCPSTVFHEHLTGWPKSGLLTGHPNEVGSVRSLMV